jgi:hypothetical protein
VIPLHGTLADRLLGTWLISPVLVLLIVLLLMRKGESILVWVGVGIGIWMVLGSLLCGVYLLMI